MKLTNFVLDIKHDNPKILLLYRFHVAIILVNLIAIAIDTSSGKYLNVFIEVFAVSILFLNLLYIRKKSKLQQAAYVFIFTISSMLFTLIYINQFASMSVVFILLLPLSSLLFLELKQSLFITILMFGFMALLLYMEFLNNPDNVLAQNSTAMFNLAYTAVIIYVFGLLYHFSILKTFNELDASNHQKALLLKEVHHRVKNNLNVIASIIGLQESTLKGKEKEELLKSKSRIESIALVHEMLYRDEDFENIDFTHYMHRLSDLLLSMYADEHNIKVHIKSDIKNMSLNVMVQLGIMINELFTNSVKYAFLDNKGDIYIELQHDTDNYILTYSDNGIGHRSPEELLRSSSLGIKLIHLTAKQLKGNVHISSQEGLKYEIRFKYA